MLYHIFASDFSAVCCESPVQPYPKCPLLDSDLVTAEDIEENRINCNRHGSSLCILTWPFFMLEVAILIWLNCGHKGLHVVSNNTQIGCAIQTMLNSY